MTPPRLHGASNVQPRRKTYFRLGVDRSPLLETWRVQEKTERKKKKNHSISGTLVQSGPGERWAHIASRFSREAKETDEKGKMAAAKAANRLAFVSLDSLLSLRRRPDTVNPVWSLRLSFLQFMLVITQPQVFEFKNKCARRTGFPEFRLTFKRVSCAVFR